MGRGDLLGGYQLARGSSGGSGTVEMGLELVEVVWGRALCRVGTRRAPVPAEGERQTRKRMNPCRIASLSGRNCSRAMGKCAQVDPHHTPGLTPSEPRADLSPDPRAGHIRAQGRPDPRADHIRPHQTPRQGRPHQTPGQTPADPRADPARAQGRPRRTPGQTPPEPRADPVGAGSCAPSLALLLLPQAVGWVIADSCLHLKSFCAQIRFAPASSDTHAGFHLGGPAAPLTSRACLSSVRADQGSLRRPALLFRVPDFLLSTGRVVNICISNCPLKGRLPRWLWW